MKAKQTVTVETVGHILVIKPFVKKLLYVLRSKDYLTKTTAGGKVIVRVRDRFLVSRIDPDIKSRVNYPPAGFEPIVLETLCCLGWKTKRLNEVASPRPAEFDPSGLPILALATSRPRTLYQHSIPAARLLEAIAMMIIMRPKDRIVVALTRISDCKSLEKWLLRYDPSGSVMRLHSGHAPEGKARVVIGTYASLGCGQAALNKRTLLIVPDADEWTRNQYAPYLLRDAANCKLMGFVRMPQGLPLYTRDVLAGYFGLDAFDLTEKFGVRRPIRAGFLRLRVPAVGSSGDRLDILNSGIWVNASRNAQIARFGKRIAKGQRDRLQAVVPHSQLPEDELRVGILVANLRQAAQLLRVGKLAGWRLTANKIIDWDGLSADDRELLQAAMRQKRRRGKGVVVTVDGLQRVRRLDVLIRANGGAGGVDVTRPYFGVVTKSVENAIVVDVEDRHHGFLRRLAKQRQQAYLEARWRMPGIYPCETDQWKALRSPLEVNDE